MAKDMSDGEALGMHYLLMDERTKMQGIEFNYIR